MLRHRWIQPLNCTCVKAEADTLRPRAGPGARLHSRGPHADPAERPREDRERLHPGDPRQRKTERR